MKSVSRASLPYADVPALMRELATKDTVQARALRFMILTGTRQDETLEATWREFDLVGKVWTIPAERMKMEAEHKVPLSDEAVAVLQECPAGADGALVFASKLGGRMSQQTTRELLQDLRPNVKVTPHGFRASMATWAQEQDGGRAYPRPIIDAALAHYKGDATTKAYQRSTLFEPRKTLMEAWAMSRKRSLELPHERGGSVWALCLFKPKDASRQRLLDLLIHNADIIQRNEGKNRSDAEYLAACMIIDDLQKRPDGRPGYVGDGHEERLPTRGGCNHLSCLVKRPASFETQAEAELRARHAK